MSRPQIQITLIDQKGTKGCHRGHKIGDSYDFDTERGNLCPMAMHVAFPYVDILRFGGEIPGNPKGTAIFACPDVDTLNVFKFERIDENKRLRRVPFKVPSPSATLISTKSLSCQVSTRCSTSMRYTV